MKAWHVAALALVLVVSMVGNAEAYLDPGTGSFVFQTLMATVVGSAFVLKTYWRRIKALFSRPSANLGKDDPQEQAHGDRS